VITFPKRKIIIIGGSIGGLFSAIFLRRKGFDVEVFERADGLSDRGAGIATQKSLHDVLAKAEVVRPDGTGVEIDGRIMFASDGNVLGTHDMDQIMTSWGLVHRSLQERIPRDCYHNSKNMVSLEQDVESVYATFEDGTAVEGDFLIGADGTWSSTRQCVNPEAKVDYCGYFIWRGLIDEMLIPRDVFGQISRRLTFGMAPGGHWLGYLVAGSDDDLTVGRRRFNWAWYRPGTEEFLRELLTDGKGIYHQYGIPHGLVQKKYRNAMREEAKKRLAPQLQEIIMATETPFLQPIYEYMSERMLFGRVALVGDAAFTARPHVAVGVSKAAEDALALSEALSCPEPNVGLRQFEHDRIELGRAIAKWGQDLGSYCGTPAKDEASQKKALYYQRPEVLLSVTAATDPSAYYLDERKI